MVELLSKMKLSDMSLITRNSFGEIQQFPITLYCPTTGERFFAQGHHNGWAYTSLVDVSQTWGEPQIYWSHITPNIGLEEVEVIETAHGKLIQYKDPLMEGEA